MAEAVVIGAGLGGLSAAIVLAARGWRTTVVEAHGSAGGKAGTATVDGVTFDTGPSVLTLPEAFDAILAEGGTRLRDEVVLREPEPAFRYLWPDGTTFDVHTRSEATLAEARRSLGAAAEAELAGFLAYAARIWGAAAPRFVQGPAPGFGSLLSLGALRDLSAIDPLHTMAGAIRGRVRDPHLRDVLLRYATYVGSDPEQAPATLNCIAHVELGLGGYGVEGGIEALVAALVRTADRLGVGFRFGERVERVRIEGGRATGVCTDRGEWPAAVVIGNAEATHVLGMSSGARPAPVPTSTSGFTAVIRARRATRVAHTVLFPADYRAEFTDLFRERRVPIDPTVYLCAQEPCHGRAGWPEHEAVFAMVNAPPDTPDDPVDWTEVEARMLGRIRHLLDPTDQVVWRRTPRELAARFPGSRGALYGAASHGPWSAFARPRNRVPGVQGLYLASGSAHPGGGMPLCALSGLAAADAVREDLRGDP